MLTRRELPLALVGAPLLCCDTPDIPAAGIAYQGGSILVDLRQAPWLLRPGSAGKIVEASRQLNLIVTHPEKNRFAALDRKCTHSGGQVAYNRGRRTVQCTCWGHSEFALDGAVLGGPAKQPLRTYAVRAAGSRLEILWKAEA